jgi:hypothetical protein
MNEHEVFHNWVDAAIEQIETHVSKLKKENVIENEILYEYMLNVSGKMLSSFMKNGDDRLLGHIERMQELMRTVKRLNTNASSM